MKEMMRVPVFAGEGQLQYENRPVPHPVAPDDVVLSISACGICGTDLNILAVPPAHKAAPGIVLGHEAVSTVLGGRSIFQAVDAGPGTGVAGTPVPQVQRDRAVAQQW
ncbi:MAG: alcohol dehydrogenase catalytic domain-containing protein [Chloroflexi bacterium]|nr:alcohol dehydrogenase catalytic domain-containing protein [Chloroflexota bacterium]